MSLAFHIVFAALGIGMPLLMAIAEGMYLRTKQQFILISASGGRRAPPFCLRGAVSGTVLSFELGLLWPGFMEHAGQSLECRFRWRFRVLHRSHFSGRLSLRLEAGFTDHSLALRVVVALSGISRASSSLRRMRG